MSSSQLPPTAIPKPLAEDDDDVSWALQTAAVQWGRGAYQDAIVWLRRAAESAIELNAWSRGADLNATASKLDKLVARALSGSGSPSTPPASPSSIPVGAPSYRPGPSVQPTPSFPVPAQMGPSTAPAPAAFGRRVTSGYSSFPPVPAADSIGPPRNSVVIDDVQEAELELSEAELRELEADSNASDIPDGHRPSGFAPVPPSQPIGAHVDADQLPSFALEPSRPLRERPSNPMGLPAFELEPSGRMPSVQTRSSGPAALPSFPLETGGSSLPPVSKWPLHGRPGTSKLPPVPGIPPVPAFRDDGFRGDLRDFGGDDSDDGTTGIDDELAHRAAFGTLPPVSAAEFVADDEIEEIEGSDVDEISPVDGFKVASDHGNVVESVPPLPSFAPESKAQPSSSPKLPVRGRIASSRPRPSVTPLPPARPSVQPRSQSPSPKSSEPRLPARVSIEPRLPARKPISPTSQSLQPSDFESISPGERRSSSRMPVQQSVYNAPTEPKLEVAQSRGSMAPTERKLELPRVESRSGPPSSARAIEPQDLPTISGPSISSPPPGLRSDVPPPPSSDSGRSKVASSELPAAVSVHPPAPVVEEPLAVLPKVSTRPSSKAPEDTGAMLMGVNLADVRGFSDLPAHALATLVTKASIERLNTGEEASFFSVALVLEGWVSLMPAIADSACATAVVGEVVFTEGTLGNGQMLRVVAGQDHVVVATWDTAAIVEATSDCPWIADDLKLLADGFQALAGACLGPLGDRLDDSLRSIVTSRCEIRTLLPGEQLCTAKKPVPGMHIIGGGEVELYDESGRVMKTHGTGEFLYATQVLAGGGAPYSARAGSQGALVLFAPRMAAHELLVSVPPLLEILAE